MNCLTGYIGLQACAEQDVPESEAYINSLPGISLESIDKIADAEQITYKGVWADAQEQAYVRFRLAFIQALNQCHTITKHCDYNDLICENKEHLTSAWMYLLGNQLMLFRLYTPRLNRFTTVDLKQAEALLNFYQVEFEKALEVAVKFVDVSGCCQMVCNNNPQSVTWLP